VNELLTHPHKNKHHHAANFNHAGNQPAHRKHHANHTAMIKDFSKRFWISLLLTVPIIILSPLFQHFLGLGDSLKFPGDLYINFLLSSVVFFYGGWPFLRGLFLEIRSRNPAMMTLIAIAISVAYLYSSAVIFGIKGKMFFWELVTLVDIMLLGHWIEMKSVMRASGALETLAKLMPSGAHKLMEDNSIREIPLEELKTGYRVLIRPGEKIPADGQVIDGETTVNESLITGESRPITKHSGDKTIGGSINGQGSITIIVEKTAKDSYLSQVIRMVQQAQQNKSRTQNLADRAAYWLTIISISAGAATMLIWWIIFSKDFSFALERTVTVMIIACPHALGLAIPLAVAISTAISARQGLLIRNRTAFEKARKLQVVIFDKTGTLTEGKFAVSDVVILKKGVDKKQLLEYAASVERFSEHPIARAIVGAAEETVRVSDFKSIPGKGVQARIDDKTLMIVSSRYLRENNIDIKNHRIEALNDQGKSVVFLLINNEPWGAIALGDVVRQNSRKAIDHLKRMGIQSIMLSGDNQKVARAVAGELEMAEYFAEVLPDQKANMVKKVQSRGLVVGMAGDGVNDAPALTQADVGIAIGAGTDVAIETADIVLVKNNPENVTDIISLSRVTYRKMLQNLLWATGYNIIAIPLAAGALYKFGILLSPAIGAMLMSLSTVIVAVNSQLIKIKQPDI
jgi:Cu2+-exporting ATPase